MQACEKERGRIEEDTEILFPPYLLQFLSLQVMQEGKKEKEKKENICMGNCCKDKTRKGGVVLAGKKGKENIAKQERYIKTYKPFLRQSIYIKEECLSVCLFVCSDLEAKLLDGSQPNLAWATSWSMWVTSKYFFWVDPPRGGIILEKLKK